MLSRTLRNRGTGNEVVAVPIQIFPNQRRLIQVSVSLQGKVAARRRTVVKQASSAHRVAGAQVVTVKALPGTAPPAGKERTTSASRRTVVWGARALRERAPVVYDMRPNTPIVVEAIREVPS